MTDLKITLLQTDLIWENPEKNLQMYDAKLSGLAQQQDIIVLPEMFNTGFTMNVENLAEQMTGNTIQWMKQKAYDLDAVVAGSLLIKESGNYYNRFIWMQPDGSFEHYDKRHLFSMVGEDKVMARGNSHTIVHYKNWKINLQICYDLRFPVWSKNNYSTAGHDYDVMVYIANWPEIRSDAYKKLLMARAIENQAFVVWVNRIGKDGNGIYHSGDSMLVDPVGNVVDQVNAGEEKTLTVTLSYSLLEKIRNKFRFAADWDRFEVL